MRRQSSPLLEQADELELRRTERGSEVAELQRLSETVTHQLDGAQEELAIANRLPRPTAMARKQAAEGRGQHLLALLGRVISIEGRVQIQKRVDQIGIREQVPRETGKLGPSQVKGQPLHGRLRQIEGPVLPMRAATQPPRMGFAGIKHEERLVMRLLDLPAAFD